MIMSSVIARTLRFQQKIKLLRYVYEESTLTFCIYSRRAVPKQKWLFFSDNASSVHSHTQHQCCSHPKLLSQSSRGEGTFDILNKLHNCILHDKPHVSYHWIIILHSAKFLTQFLLKTIHETQKVSSSTSTHLHIGQKNI